MTADSAGIRTRSVVLVGGSGLLGFSLRQYLVDRVLAATYHERPFEGGVPFDAARDSLARLVTVAGRPADVAILMHGISSIDACAADPARSWAINVMATIRLVDECAALGILPCFVSSDAVFDGGHGLWLESDAACALHDYGRQKRAVESRLEAMGRPFLTVRLPKLLALEPHRSCLVSDWLRSLRIGRPIDCAVDQRFTPIAAADAARILVALIDRGATGLFHVPGPEAVSRDELLGKTIAALRAVQAVEADIRYCRLRDIPTRVPRPVDSTLASERLPEELQRGLFSLDDVCRRLVAAPE